MLRLAAFTTVLVSFAALASCSTDSVDADSLESRLDAAYDDTSDLLGDGATALRDSGACLADAARQTWGDERAEQFGIEGSTVDTQQLLEELGAQADSLETLVEGCVEVRDTLIAGFEGIGLSEESASCATDVVIDDPALRNSLVIQLLFGDPGLGTAFVAAARVARQCLDPDELPLIGESPEPT